MALVVISLIEVEATPKQVYIYLIRCKLNSLFFDIYRFGEFIVQSEQAVGNLMHN